MPAGAVQGDGEVQVGSGSWGHVGAFLDVRVRTPARGAGRRRGRARQEESLAEGPGRDSAATERGGHALQVYVRPGVQTDGAVRVRGTRRERTGHGRHLRRSVAAGRDGVRLSVLVMTSNAPPAPVVPVPRAPAG
ncbi:hypothetical protein GCM10010260_51760 [Streptomyces filipinensis]|uniref:Uncharacterized protein n=1 Tax=Streptomyces filipinensis TaxID=66887 RepID=A0A918IEH8_9ACTN|nr:hypothetical protein GCM10010260_51760 [Streptomyces filipinensis]